MVWRGARTALILGLQELAKGGDNVRAKMATARTDGLLVEKVGDETVIYDTVSKHAHCLSPLAAAVFEHCDGRTPVDQAAKAVSESLGEPVDAVRVLDAVAQLEERELMAPPPTLRASLSRREMIRRTAAVGAAAAATPLIVSIVAPTPAAAATPTCGDILCCACSTGPQFGQPCCIHPTAIQCNCTAKESGASCKQCKPQGPAANEVRCREFYPPSGFPPNHDSVCVCTFTQTECAQT